MTNTNYPSASPQNQPTAPKKNGNKNLLIGILAAGLLGTWGYLLWDKNNSGRELAEQKNRSYQLHDTA